MHEMHELCLVGQPCLWSHVQPWIAMTHMVEDNLQWVRPKGLSCPLLCPASPRVARAEQGIVIPHFSFRFWLNCSFGTAELQAACELHSVVSGQILS